MVKLAEEHVRRAMQVPDNELTPAVSHIPFPMLPCSELSISISLYMSGMVTSVPIAIVSPKTSALPPYR